MRSDCGGRRYGFKDQNTRYRKRYLDLIFNPEVPDPQSTLAPRGTARRNKTLLRALEPRRTNDSPKASLRCAGWRSPFAAVRFMQSLFLLPQVRDVFVKRSRIIQFVRDFLQARDFIEVCATRRPRLLDCFRACVGAAVHVSVRCAIRSRRR